MSLGKPVGTWLMVAGLTLMDRVRSLMFSMSPQSKETVRWSEHLTGRLSGGPQREVFQIHLTEMKPQDQPEDTREMMPSTRERLFKDLNVLVFFVSAFHPCGNSILGAFKMSFLKINSKFCYITLAF